MIRAVIFDCFGVLCYGGYYFLREQAPEENKQAVYDCNQAFDGGYLTVEEYLETLAELLGWSPQAVAKSINTRYHRNEAVFSLARSLKPDYKIGLLSNIGPGIVSELFTKDDTDNLFDAFIISGEVGLMKPQAEIFELTAQRLGVAVGECLMIDDLEPNVDGARAAGMAGILFENTQQCRQELVQHSML